jgi:hypothetical protein
MNWLVGSVDSSFGLILGFQVGVGRVSAVFLKREEGEGCPCFLWFDGSLRCWFSFSSFAGFLSLFYLCIGINSLSDWSWRRSASENLITG